VVRQLIAGGVARESIGKVEGLGSKDPVGSNGRLPGRQSNRRVELFLYER
jgi:flagellar motor protein MotB